MESTRTGNREDTQMTPAQRPYFEAVTQVYYDAACKLYQLAAGADFDCDDPAAFIARANEMNAKAGETWTMTTRQVRRLAMLKARAELNTPDGLAHRQRIIDAVSGCAS
jgi:hypothetical protein